MLDLKRFTNQKECVVPIVDGWGRCGGRSFKIDIANGWHLLSLGNSVTVLRRASLLEVEETVKKYKKYSGYALGSEVVPFNFQNVFQLGYGESIPINFLQSEPWDIVNFILFDDKRFYSVGPDYRSSRHTLLEIKDRFEKEERLEGIKNVTPELRYYFLLLSLQRQGVRELEELNKLQLAAAEREQRLKEFQSTFVGRLQKTVEDAGGSFVKYEPFGSNRFLVTWKVGGQTVKSTINEQMRISDLGFCASGADRNYFLDSAITLAQEFQEDDPLYITRH